MGVQLCTERTAHFLGGAGPIQSVTLMHARCLAVLQSLLSGAGSSEDPTLDMTGAFTGLALGGQVRGRESQRDLQRVAGGGCERPEHSAAVQGLCVTCASLPLQPAQAAHGAHVPPVTIQEAPAAAARPAGPAAGPVASHGPIGEVPATRFGS
jgi:hypothetical protein